MKFINLKYSALRSTRACRGSSGVCPGAEACGVEDGWQGYQVRTKVDTAVQCLLPFIPTSWCTCTPVLSVVMPNIKAQKSSPSPPRYVHVQLPIHFSGALFTFAKVLKIWILKCFICFILRTIHVHSLISSELFSDD